MATRADCFAACSHVLWVVFLEETSEMLVVASRLFDKCSGAFHGSDWVRSDTTNAVFETVLSCLTAAGDLVLPLAEVLFVGFAPAERDLWLVWHVVAHPFVLVAVLVRISNECNSHLFQWLTQAYLQIVVEGSEPVVE